LGGRRLGGRRLPVSRWRLLTVLRLRRRLAVARRWGLLTVLWLGRLARLLPVSRRRTTLSALPGVTTRWF